LFPLGSLLGVALLSTSPAGSLALLHELLLFRRERLAALDLLPDDVRVDGLLSDRQADAAEREFE
jgi:hypothetical protein